MEETTTLKDERINETNTAANAPSDSTEVKTETKETVATTPTKVNETSLLKNDMVKMIGYPVIIGSVVGFGGLFLAKKLNKNKNLFVVSGVLLGALAGYAIYTKTTKK